MGGNWPNSTQNTAHLVDLARLLAYAVGMRPKLRRITVSLPVELVDQLQEQADLELTTLSHQVFKALRGSNSKPQPKRGPGRPRTKTIPVVISPWMIGHCRPLALDSPDTAKVSGAVVIDDMGNYFDSDGYPIDPTTGQIHRWNSAYFEDVLDQHPWLKVPDWYRGPRPAYPSYEIENWADYFEPRNIRTVKVDPEQYSLLLEANNGLPVVNPPYPKEAWDQEAHEAELNRARMLAHDMTASRPLMFQHLQKGPLAMKKEEEDQ